MTNTGGPVFRLGTGQPNHRRRPARLRVDQIEHCQGHLARRKRKKIDTMQVTETLAEGLKHEFKISVPASDLDAKADAKLVDLKDKVKLNGFRPGKVPVSHLKKVYGRSVMAETIDQTIRDTNTQIFTDRGFRLATEPKITMPTEQNEVEELLAGKTDLTYTVAIEVVPTIQLADFKTFSVEKPVVEVTGAEVDEAIKRIADQNRPYAAKAEGAKAETGDRVTISFKGSIDGVPFDGGTGEGIPVVIGAGQFIPGFEEQLVGMGAGETRTLKVSFPTNYASEKLAGQPAEFETTATLIEAPGETKIDDEFAKTLGLESLDKLKEAARERARSMPGREKEVWDYYRNNANALAQLRAPIYEDKVVDFILELANVTEKKVSREDLFKEDDEKSAA